MNNASPAPSANSRRAPSRVDNVPSTEANVVRRDQNARISYFDPSNQATLDRLILGTDAQTEGDGEEENTQATLINVEEMIEGYEWASDDVMGRKMTRGAVDMIEARLLDELMALEKVRKCSQVSVRNALTFPRLISIRSWNQTTALAL